VTIGQLAIIVGAALIAMCLSIWIIFKPKLGKHNDQSKLLLSEQAKNNVESIFNDEFREELKNRGRLHFEKIIGENAMFLQQDLRLTTSQVNDYMKDEIKRVLKDEFSKYEESINDAKNLALDTIQKTQATIDQQRMILEKQMNEQAAIEKQRIISRFEQNMTDIINHYILEAIGNEIDISAQADFIFQYLEANKQAIIEDINSGS